ncbi:Cerato-ulmin hydrophobin family [Apiospora sp. TS-2023a]
MQFTPIILALAATAFANPILQRNGGGGGGGDGGDCGGSPLAAFTTLAAMSFFTVSRMSELPKSAENFQEICAGSGQQAKCCTLPVLGQALVCNTPIGVTA